MPPTVRQLSTSGGSTSDDKEAGLLASERLALTQALERASLGDSSCMLLNYAAFWKRPKAVELLGHLGESFEKEDANGDTVLHWAARGACPATVRAAMVGGADPQHVNFTGHTPVTAANMLGNAQAALAITTPLRKAPSRRKHSIATSAMLKRSMPSGGPSTRNNSRFP